MLGMTVLGARLFLLGVLGVAALAKFADRARFQTMLRDSFSVPRRLLPVVSIAVPAVELIVAAALVPSASARWAAIAAGALLAGFTGALLLARARGAADCNCFGASRYSRIGRAALVRNIVLLCLAGLVGGAGPGASATSWLAQPSTTALLTAAGLIYAAGLGLLAWFVWELLRQQGRLLRRLDSLEAASGQVDIQHAATETLPVLPRAQVGERAPELGLATIDGADREASQSDRSLRVFFDPGCGPCTAILPTVAALARDPSRPVDIVPIASGDAEDIRATAVEHGLTGVLWDPERTAANAHGIAGTPAAVLVQDGRIAWTGLGAATLLEQLEHLHGEQPQLPTLAGAVGRRAR
jgi:hypothetical protein